MSKWLNVYNSYKISSLVNSDSIAKITIEKFDHKAEGERVEYFVIGFSYKLDQGFILSKPLINFDDAQMIMFALRNYMNGVENE